MNIVGFLYKKTSSDKEFEKHDQGQLKEKLLQKE